MAPGDDVLGCVENVLVRVYRCHGNVTRNAVNRSKLRIKGE